MIIETLRSAPSRRIIISAFTRGDVLAAGSRLRSFYLFRLAEKYSLIVDRPLSYGSAVNSDIIHIQKIYSWETLRWVIKFRLLGKKVIFDICDQVNRRSEFPRVVLIILFSSVLTVDNESRKKYWHKFFPLKKIIVIPDIADTKDIYIESIPYQLRNQECEFFWIGNSQNFKSIKKFSDLVKDCPEYRLTVAMDIKNYLSLSQQFPHIKFYTWEPDIAFNNNIHAKFMILNHAIDKNSSIKSNNKMVLALVAGYIPIVSNTPAYAHLANQLDANFLIFEDLDDVPRIAKKIAHNFNSQQFFKNALDVINRNYSSDAVLSRFYKLVLNEHH